jgi:hypothetical protein
MGKCAQFGTFSKRTCLRFESDPCIRPLGDPAEADPESTGNSLENIGWDSGKKVPNPFDRKGKQD